MKSTWKNVYHDDACDLGHKHALSFKEVKIFLVSPDNHCYRDAFPFEKGNWNFATFHPSCHMAFNEPPLPSCDIGYYEEKMNKSPRIG